MKESRLFIAALVWCVLFAACKDSVRKKPIDGIRSQVVEVKSGNEIELQNGLTVELLGFEPTETTKEYLQKMVLGQEVTVVADSRQVREVASYINKVKAYVKLDRGYCVSGTLIRIKLAKAHLTGEKYDSLEHFVQYAKEERREPMSVPELKVYLKPRTFKIVLKNGHSGTGFFINNNGLALTNNHVLDGTVDADIYFFGDNGSINTKDSRHVGDVIHTVRDGNIDYTIFYVNLISGERVEYIPLIRQHEREGETLAKLGSPLNESENFQTGILSTYYEGYFTHNCGSAHGDSGGPIVNLRGEAVGVNQSIVGDYVYQEDGTRVDVHSKIGNAVDAVLIRSVLDNDLKIPYGH